LRAGWDRTKGTPEPIAALNRIRERENGEPLVDVRVACPSILTPRPQVIPYLRETVAQMLETAAQNLPKPYRFGVVECWRPIERQRRIFEWHMDAAREALPNHTHALLRRTVCRFVAPVNQKAPPGHCTGAAVDVHLYDGEGDYVDVSKPYERFSAPATYSIGLDPEAHRHRMMLVEAMLGAGFSNCRDEWWHYSWGDAGWAVRTGVSECPYGMVELAPELYEEQERLWLESYRDRANPFLKPKGKG
jgi:zinc D-Ala-D-Ala dipeptidase